MLGSVTIRTPLMVGIARSKAEKVFLIIHSLAYFLQQPQLCFIIERLMQTEKWIN
jgi:hypothetical protein